MKREAKRHVLVDHYLEFYNRAVAILNDEDDAKDAVQDALVKTLLAIGVRDPVAYCFRATVNRSISILRHKRLTVRGEDMQLLTAYGEEEIVKMVRDGKATLSPLERKVLEYHFEEDYTVAHISAMMGVSVSTVKRLIGVAKMKMKEELK